MQSSTLVINKQKAARVFSWKAALCLAVLSLVPGCGPASDAPEIHLFSGTLTYNGKPVEDVLLMFQPTNGRPSVAQVGSGGKFKMRFSSSVDGVARDTHTIYVEPAFEDPNAPNPTAEMKEIFEKYSRESSEFTVHVLKDEEDYKLELQ